MEDKYKTPPKMQESYDKNKEPEFDKAVEDAVNTTERGTVERKDALLDAGKKKDLQNRLYQSMGFEFGAGAAVDAVTTPLAALPPVYAAVNFAAGSGINALAQLWRGDGNFNWGEVAASGAVGVIPGLGGKATIAKGALKGGVSGVAHEAIRIGIDEKRLPTAEEALVGGTIGGVVGGGVTGAIKGGSALKNRLNNRIDYDEILDPNVVFRPGSAQDLFRKQNVIHAMSPSNAWFPKDEAKLRRIAKQRGWSLTQAEQLDPSVFSDDSPSGVKKIFASDQRKRELASQALTDIEVTKEVNDLFKSSGKEMLAEYEDALGFTFEDIKVPTDIHHIAILRQIASATEGLLPEWRIKGGKFMAKRLRRKIGFDPENAIPLPRVFHKRLHNIINAQIGDGQWSIKGIEKKLNLPKDWKTSYTHRQRMKVYQEIIDPIARSVDHINLFWNQLQTRSGGTTLSAKEYMKQTLAVIDLDKLLQKTPSAGKALTATQIIDDILEAAKVGWKSPVFKPLTADMTQEAIKLTRQENGWTALYEAVVMNQSYATIKKTYGFNVPVKLVKAIQKDDKAYQYMLRSRHQSVRLTDPRGTQGVNPDD